MPASNPLPTSPHEQQNSLSGSAATHTDWYTSGGQQGTSSHEARSPRRLNINFAASRRGITCSVTLLFAFLVLASSVAYLGIFNRPAGSSISGTTSSSNAVTSTAAATSATSIPALASATATVLQNIYKQATSGTPVLDDPLRDNSKGYNWDVGSAQGGVCQFTNGSYQVSMSQPDMFYRCTARATNFVDFAFQVQVTLVKGDQAGIIFRFDEITANSYTFYISSEGTYALNIDSKQGFISQLANGSSSAIKTGPNQSNLVAVLARGSQIYLYVNGQYLASVQDSTYKNGAIGVIAENNGHPTEALFNDVKVWSL